jgi:hypothetical protein
MRGEHLISLSGRALERKAATLLGKVGVEEHGNPFG